jgi:dimethylamine/trimethylamine dehydrogenase
MTRSAHHDILFEPLRIGPKTLRNRFYAVPHCTGFGSDRPRMQARFRAMKAEGGWAAVCTEYAPVSPESDEWPFAAARLWDKVDTRNLALTCEDVHAHGALAGIELVHTGVHAEERESRLPLAAPSQLASPFEPNRVPKAMDKGDIRRVQDDWVHAARRARSAGFDIVYVYGGHSYLPLQFLSPFYNRRTDEYGGPLENRARFWLETLERVRDAIGDDCAIAVRFSVEAVGTAGVHLDEGLEFIGLADHLVDLWDVVVGELWGEHRIDSGASRLFPQGYQLEWTGRVRDATKKPIVGVGRLTDPDLMARIVRSGTWDLIGAARPSISDPFLPKKIEQGRLDDIRECIGCNVCYSRSVFGSHIACTQNATAGEEYRRGWHPEKLDAPTNADHDVLVVGAGPAGMECAMVLGKRGMRRVHLVEAADDMGGIMRWIPQLPGLGEWARVVNYRKIQIDKLKNVEFIPSTKLDTNGVREYGAEIVVIATGAYWAMDGLNGATHDTISGADASLPYILTPEQIMDDGKNVPGQRVLVYDCEGYFMAAGLAEKLRLDGFTVDFATPLPEIAPLCDETLEGPLLRRHLHEIGVSLHRRLTLKSIERDRVEATDEFGATIEVAAESVVLVTHRLSNEELYLDLCSHESALRAEGIEAVYRIGDCVAPRIIAEAIFDGHRLAREIDSESPGIPLPYRRERPQAGRSLLSARSAACHPSSPFE